MTLWNRKFKFTLKTFPFQDDNQINIRISYHILRIKWDFFQLCILINQNQ